MALLRQVHDRRSGPLLLIPAALVLLASLAIIVMLAIFGSTTATAEAWDSTRKRLIEPLNAKLHSHWPNELKERNLDVLLRLYATETGTGLTWADPRRVSTGANEETLRWMDTRGEESIRDRYTRLLEFFAKIQFAEQRIERVDWRNPGPLGYRATVHVIIRGTGPEGQRRQLEQWATLHVRFFDPFWEITSEEVTDRTVVTEEIPRFESVSEKAQIDSVHANEASPPFRLFGNSEDNPVSEASGVAVGDADGDGCEDLVLAGSPDLIYYRSRCDGTFEDATRESGLPNPYPAAASGVVFFDYDNDGWSDLFVAAVSGGDRLFHNEGKGKFIDVSKRAGVGAGRWGSMPVVADYDRDGYLDLYIARMGDHELDSPRPPNDARNGVRGTLLHNQGDGTFADVSKQAGVDSPGWDMAAAWGDYTGDGWPDLYVANEFGNNRLYRNERNGTFSDQTKAAGALDGGSAMGVTWGDIDGDGDLDLFVSGMHANSGWILFHPDFPLPIPWYYRFIGLFTDAVQIRSDEITDQLSRGSTLLRNDGDGRFTDISDGAGVRDGQWGWGAEFLDYDNDGYLDLYAVNGFITGPIEDDV
jgi:hypothetical protein